MSHRVHIYVCTYILYMQITYMCICIYYVISVEIPPPTLVRDLTKSISIECTFEQWQTSTDELYTCYLNCSLSFSVVWYPVISGVPDVTQLQNATFSSSDTVVIDGLMSDTEYIVNITALAKCAENGDVVSDPLFLNVTTLGEQYIVTCLFT